VHGYDNLRKSARITTCGFDVFAVPAVVDQTKASAVRPEFSQVAQKEELTGPVLQLVKDRVG